MSRLDSGEAALASWLAMLDTLSMENSTGTWEAFLIFKLSSETEPTRISPKSRRVCESEANGYFPIAEALSLNVASPALCPENFKTA